MKLLKWLSEWLVTVKEILSDKSHTVIIVKITLEKRISRGLYSGWPLTPEEIERFAYYATDYHKMRYYAKLMRRDEVARLLHCIIYKPLEFSHVINRVSMAQYLAILLERGLTEKELRDVKIKQELYTLHVEFTKIIKPYFDQALEKFKDEQRAKEEAFALIRDNLKLRKIVEDIRTLESQVSLEPQFCFS